uniref:Eukaryotic translation initiation factor 5B n=1 Tax=Timema poppense TaxID=170557 RepID=A0A7R9CND5_TIMPO|nr:unnamed protein product [Timema poppensis]
MGKAKKGKKGTKEDEMKRGESEEVDIDSANESEIELSSKKKKGKKKKKAEDDEDDDIDELAKQLEDLPLDKGKKNKKTGKVKVKRVEGGPVFHFPFFGGGLTKHLSILLVMLHIKLYSTSGKGCDSIVWLDNTHDRPTETIRPDDRPGYTESRAYSNTQPPPNPTPVSDWKEDRQCQSSASTAKSKVVDDSSDDEDDTPAKAPPKAKKKDGVDRSTAGVSDQDDELIKVKSKQTKTSTVKPKGFALLNIEGDSSDSESDQSTKGLDSEEEIDIVQKTSKNGGKKVIRSDSLKEDSDVVNADRTKEEKAGKKGKKSKKKKQEDEEDIDKVLAELAQEYGDVTKEEVPVTERVEQINYDDVITKKEKKKKKKAKAEAEPGEPKTTEEDKEESKDAIEGEELAGTMKSAAQKKKEKKEREKLKKLTQKLKCGEVTDADIVAEVINNNSQAEDGASGDKEDNSTVEPIKKEESLEGDEENASLGATLEDKEKPTPETAELNVDTAGNEEEEADEDDDDKKKKKKKKGAKVEDTGKEKKGPGKKTIAAMQEALKKIRDDEEKAAREEEEQLRRLEEEEKARQEQLKLEQERKERKKQKEKERKERMKAEGKLLTQKQKTDRARAQALLDALKAQGLDMPNVGEKKAPRPGTRVRPNKAKQQTSVEEQKPASQEQQVEVKIVDSVQTNAKQLPAEETIDVKDSWDAESSGGEDEDRSETAEPTVGKPVERQKSQEEEEEESDKDEDEEDESEEEDSSSEESEDSEDDHKTDAERKREKALSRIHKRRQENEKNKTLDELRAAVVCVLGHVDTDHPFSPHKSPLVPVHDTLLTLAMQMLDMLAHSRMHQSTHSANLNSN